MCPELMQTLFRAQNKYEFPDFMMNKCKGIVAILVNCPQKGMSEMVQRMSDSESSLGEKLILIETIQMAVV